MHWSTKQKHRVGLSEPLEGELAPCLALLDPDKTPPNCNTRSFRKFLSCQFNTKCKTRTTKPDSLSASKIAFPKNVSSFYLKEQTMIVKITMCNTLNTTAQWNLLRRFGIIIIIKRDSAWDDWSLYLSLLVELFLKMKKHFAHKHPPLSVQTKYICFISTCTQKAISLYCSWITKKSLFALYSTRVDFELYSSLRNTVWKQGSVSFTHCKNVARFSLL